MDVDSVLKQLTLEEKASLCSGKDFWHLKGVERLGLPEIMVTDGPHGLRKQAGSADHLGINKSVPATCFPTACATASSWDVDLLHQMGQALAEECLAEQVSVVLGPGVNIKRSPLCGRNFEYFSEDPLLAGKLAASFINGVQSKGVGTSIKHYAANSQEKLRMTSNSVVDERALREIYLAAFETAVKEAQPWTVMCSYNRLNGVYASEDKKLLTDILKDEWGHEGLVVTDWGANNNRVDGLAAGQELEMPASGGYNDAMIVAAVQSGRLDEAVLDRAVRRLLALILQSRDNLQDGYTYDVEAHHALARSIAAQSMVLLKNEGALPLAKTVSLAVVGEFAQTPRYQGAGSSRINPTRLDSALDAFAERGVAVQYAPGYSLKSDAPDEALVAAACAAAEGKDCVVVFAGLPDAYESEGFDRADMNMPASHNQLIERLAAVNPNVVVVLSGGAPVEMPWAAKVKGILNGYLAGQAGGSAAVQLLLGEVNPSGKLAESYPAALTDVPCQPYWHKDDHNVEYRESIFVGYRYYDAAGVPVAYPFGYGLSYTSFEYANLTLSKPAVNEDETLTVKLDVKNTGSVAGAEIVQLYVRAKGGAAFRPQKELKAFCKVFLQPGGQKTVEMTLNKRTFAYYNAPAACWHVESGAYELLAAASSQDIRLRAEVQVTGSDMAVPDYRAAAPCYYNLRAPEWKQGVPAAQFAAVYGSPLPRWDENTPYSMNSTLGEIKDTPVGQQLLAQLAEGMKGMLGDGEDNSMAPMFEAMMGEMPLRNLLMLGGGAMTPEALQGMVAALNAGR